MSLSCHIGAQDVDLAVNNHKNVICSYIVLTWSVIKTKVSSVKEMIDATL